jgi:hypothetical protein
MVKDDLITMLNKSIKLIETNNLSYWHIRKLWMNINCLMLTIEEIVKKNKIYGDKR